MRRIFVDANVLVAGGDSRSGASNAVLQLAEVGLFRLVASRQVLDEVERNVRKKLPRALPNLVALLAQLPFEIVSDPADADCLRWVDVIELKDTPILAAAVLAKVDRMITLNTNDFTPEVAQASSLSIQTPSASIQDLRRLVDEHL
jgi:predicted nucleic acid-binding protein